MTCSLNFLKEYSHAITSVCIKHGKGSPSLPPVSETQGPEINDLESIRMPHWTKPQAAWFNFVILFQEIRNTVLFYLALIIKKDGLT